MTPLRVRIHAADPVRRHGLTAMLAAGGHVATDDSTPDVELCDQDQPPLQEAEAPVLALSPTPPSGNAPAGLLLPDATPDQLNAALCAVAAGLIVRSTGLRETRGFAPAEDAPLLTPRERDILTLIGEGLSNKAMARRLTISVHTVKFHMEALFAKLDATSRAEAVAKGLRGGVIEL
jgi:two-component system, NarL family, nitrate/nitrite response regulator NarL